MLIQNRYFDDQFVLESEEQAIEQKRQDLLPRDKLDNRKHTPKAKMPKRQLSLPDTYSLMILGD